MVKKRRGNGEQLFLGVVTKDLKDLICSNNRFVCRREKGKLRNFWKGLALKEGGGEVAILNKSQKFLGNSFREIVIYILHHMLDGKGSCYEGCLQRTKGW